MCSACFLLCIGQLLQCLTHIRSVSQQELAEEAQLGASKKWMHMPADAIESNVNVSHLHSVLNMTCFNYSATGDQWWFLHSAVEAVHLFETQLCLEQRYSSISLSRSAFTLFAESSLAWSCCCLAASSVWRSVSRFRDSNLELSSQKSTSHRHSGATSLTTKGNSGR